MGETVLDEAERHVREGAIKIAQQRELLRSLDPNTQLAAVAQQLLFWLEEMHASDIEHLEELRTKN